MKTPIDPLPEGQLRRALLAYSRAENLPERRLRDWVSYMMLAAILDSTSGGRRRATIKGGVAIELRLHPTTRATQDIDLALDAAPGHLLPALDDLLISPQGAPRTQHGFSFQRKGVAVPLPQNGVRVELQVSYLGRAWTSIRADLTPAALAELAHETVPAIELTALGLSGPATIQVLALTVQVPQKIHGMTRPPRSWETRSERVRDLIDVLLLESQLPDLAALKAGCLNEFIVQGTHEWPPTLIAHDHWIDEYARLAAKFSLAHASLPAGVVAAQALIRRIDSAG